MMKKLVSIISTKGKTPEQAAQEVFQAHQKYQKTINRKFNPNNKSPKFNI